MGVTAMLQNQWPDSPFTFASLNDRRPVSADDTIVVMAAPDPPGGIKKAEMLHCLLPCITRPLHHKLCRPGRCAASCRRFDDQRASPRAVQPTIGQVLLSTGYRCHHATIHCHAHSGDVGVGLSVRRMRDRFMSSFTTTYSLRPIGEEGTVFRRYPDMWKVFISDEGMPGRYVLAAERPSRPAGDVLDLIIMEARGGGGEGTEAEGGVGLLQGLGQTVASLQRFMRSLS